jgi:hypothetical protein
MSEGITISPQRSIGGIMMDVTIEEQGIDELTITQHPVETGAAITDHAYKNPAKLSIRCGASNSSRQSGGDEGYVTEVYQKLLDLQATRQPFNIVTGKRNYKNMLFLSIGITTDQTSEAALIVTASFQEIIIVSTTTTAVGDTANQAQPGATGATAQTGTVAPVPADPPPGSGPATPVQDNI